MTRELGAMALLLMSQVPPTKDPVVTDGDKYRVLLENEHVRVLSYEDRPGDRTHPHQHPAFVLYALAPFKRKLVLPDGSPRIREFRAGDVLYSAAEAHVGENVGDTPTRVIIVELKDAAAAQATKP
jgi:quercetin dioxygenase-like cupin family protein